MTIPPKKFLQEKFFQKKIRASSTPSTWEKNSCSQLRLKKKFHAALKKCVAQAPAPSDKSKHKSMNASGKKGDESKVRRKQTTREEAKEDEILVKMVIIERTVNERNEGQQAVHQTAHCTLHTVERLRFPKENNVSSAIAVPQRVVSMQFVDGAKGMLLRCLRNAENKLMSMRQIWMTENQILKNIQSFSTEPVLHDPAELFVHLCVSTCYSKR